MQHHHDHQQQHRASFSVSALSAKHGPWTGASAALAEGRIGGLMARQLYIHYPSTHLTDAACHVPCVCLRPMSVACFGIRSPGQAAVGSTTSTTKQHSKEAQRRKEKGKVLSHLLH